MKKNINSEVKELSTCILKFFPSKIELCIEWARDYFFECFVFINSDTNRFFQDKKGFYSIF